MDNKIKILVVGCGNMGASHAQCYHEMDDFEIVGLVSRRDSKVELNKQLGLIIPYMMIILRP